MRKWFSHDPKKWRTFRSRYRTELKQHSAALQLIKSKAEEGVVTLIYATLDQEHNEAVVLKQLLTSKQVERLLEDTSSSLTLTVAQTARTLR